MDLRENQLMMNEFKSVQSSKDQTYSCHCEDHALP